MVVRLRYVLAEKQRNIEAAKTRVDKYNRFTAILSSNSR